MIQYPTEEELIARRKEIMRELHDAHAATKQRAQDPAPEPAPTPTAPEADPFADAFKSAVRDALYPRN